MRDFDCCVYKPGDTLVMEHENGSRVTLTVIEESESNWNLFDVVTKQGGIEGRLQHGWKVTSHTPAVILPTEPGLYRISDGKVLELADRTWLSPDHLRYMERQVQASKEFTLLRPVDEVRVETAAEVIEWIKAENRSSDTIWIRDNILDDARAHFGVKAVS